MQGEQRCPRPLSINVMVGSGTTGRSYPGRMPSSTSSRTASITDPPCSRASAPMAARSSSRPSIPSASRNRPQILDFEIPYTVAEIDAAKRLVLREERHAGRLSAPGRLARLGDDGRRGSSQQDPPRHRRLGMAELFRPGPEDEGHPHRHGGVPPPRSGDRSVGRQGGRPLHDLHHLQAQGGAEGLCRCADARLAGPRRGMHGRQRVLHPRRRGPYAPPPIASSTASPAAR